MEDIGDTIGAKALTVGYNAALNVRPTETKLAVKAMREAGQRMMAFADAVSDEDDTPREVTPDEFEKIVCDLDTVDPRELIATIKGYLKL